MPFAQPVIQAGQMLINLAFLFFANPSGSDWQAFA